MDSHPIHDNGGVALRRSFVLGNQVQVAQNWIPTVGYFLDAFDALDMLPSSHVYEFNLEMSDKSEDAKKANQ